MKAKRMLAAVICLNLCLTAAACGNKEDKSSKSESSSSAAETAVSETEKSTEESSETESSTDKTKSILITML